MTRYCAHCGVKVEDNEKFCSECGSMIDKKEDTPKKTIIVEDADETTDEVKNKPNNNENTKNSNSNILICIVGIVVVIIIVLGVISIFSSSGGIADIQEVSMGQKRAGSYGSIAVPGKPLEKASTTSIKIRFVPHEDILHYQNVRLVNGAVKFDDGSEMVFNNTNIHLKMDKDRSELPVDSLMYQDSWYTFKFEFKDSKFRANNLSHLKGDLVVDTTTKQNILLAHIDEDIVKK